MEQGASYGVMLVCVDAIAGAPEEEYQILLKFINILFVRTTVSGKRRIIQYALHIVIPSLLLLLLLMLRCVTIIGILEFIRKLGLWFKKSDKMKNVYESIAPLNYTVVDI